MRLKFQSKNVLYVVHSVVKYDKMGTIHQKTYYGSDKAGKDKEILARARKNIQNKFQDSSGKIISVSISAIYM